MSSEPIETLRAEHVRATRTALVAAGRRLFGTRGFAATSVDDVAREARVTTGALYHHFPTKLALFETVFLEIHKQAAEASSGAAARGRDPLDQLVHGFGQFLETVLDPSIQRILVIEGPAVLGVERFTELDEKEAHESIVGALKAAQADGLVHLSDPETMAHLLLGTLVRGALEVVTAKDPQATRKSVGTSLGELITALRATE